MKLGTETGSVMNNLYSRMTKGAPEPVPGMGATLLLWTDRHAATVIKYDAKARRVTIQQDAATVTSGSTYDGSAEYAYTADPAGETVTFKLTHNGWRETRLNTETKRWRMIDGRGLLIGQRREYRDPSF